MRECIDLFVVAESVRLPQNEQVACVDSEPSVQQLHDEQVQRSPSQEHIDVTSNEHDCVDLLCFVADARHTVGLMDFVQQDEHGDKVQQIGDELQEIHRCTLFVIIY